MTKLEFLLSLHEQLLDLPKKSVEEHLSFYSEMIEDRMEEGLSEADAVDAVGAVEEIAAQIRAEITPEQPAPVIKSQKRKTWEIVLLAAGSPIWFSLLAAVFAVVFSLYAALWSGIAALWAVFASLAVCAPAGLIGGTASLIGGGTHGLLLLAVGFICGGLAIFTFFGCKTATKSAAKLSKTCFLGIKRLFSKKEAAK